MCCLVGLASSSSSEEEKPLRRLILAPALRAPFSSTEASPFHWEEGKHLRRLISAPFQPPHRQTFHQQKPLFLLKGGEAPQKAHSPLCSPLLCHWAFISPPSVFVPRLRADKLTSIVHHSLTFPFHRENIERIFLENIVVSHV